MNKLVAFLFIVVCNQAMGSDLQDETEFKFGTGFGHTAVDSRAESKIASIAHSYQILPNSIRFKYGAALWNDSRSDLRRKSGGIAFTQIGVDVRPGAFYASYYIGPGLKAPNDSLLGGPFQFVQSFEIGLRDRTDCSIGLGVMHISSGGLESPNLGRDYMFLKVGVPF